MRVSLSIGAVVTAAALSLPTAPTAFATPSGDNGTVKIHDAKTGEDLRKNEPHVCSFYLDAFGFDAGQQVDWRIEAWAPTAGVKGEQVMSGSLTLDDDGHERTEDLTLPDGHYKLFWNFDGEHGKAKHKVFWTDCPGGDDDAKPGEKPGEEPVLEPDEKPAQEPGEKPAQEPVKEPAQDSADTPGGDSAQAPSEEPAPDAAAAAPAPSAHGDANGDGDLAETGSGAPVGMLAAVAAALVAGGGFLVARRRTARRH
ncbi:LPXTG cell wall anchor domain-containing protein [Streptomyces sp. ISL-99]|uniref:LPXTG cell wall anchor domain-containing protein n=1 Tax=Streptomyces sp. ISL-99 TaxID=2819193 RepID=UPI001BE91905|nr:LPXTG cell wall anchor domain-containing protein [Streptomyces sp. ISL-99]MBT2525940.1 LPXTG cell wall anchor domain-containing protein [Streptomyces sp. ISL-99]